MRGLLVKDWEIAKEQKKYFLTVLVIGIVLNLGSSTGFATGYLTMLMTFFIITTISYDEYDNGMLFIMSLPIKSRTYVAEKYVAALIAAVGSAIIGAACSCIMALVTHSGANLTDVLATAVMMVPVAMFIFSITIPFIMKYGVEKGRYLPLGLVGAVVVIGVVIGKTSDGAAGNVAGRLSWLNTLNEYVAVGVLYLVIAVICFVTYLISAKIIEKKEW